MHAIRQVLYVLSFIGLSIVLFSSSMTGCDGTPPGRDAGLADTKVQDTATTDTTPTRETQVTEQKTQDTQPEPPKPHDKPTGCHPFAKDKKSCILPYPSSYYLVPDTKTQTGYRVAYPEGVLPVALHNNDKKIPIRTDILNNNGGFSPATPILVLFPERVDPAQLVKSTQIAPSIDPKSSIQLIEFGTQKRIPYFAEVDKTVQAGESQVLFIRPMIRLQPKKRYAVVILKTLKAVGGGALTAPESFIRLASGKAPKTPAEAALQPGLQETLKEAQTAGLKKEEILLAWDFRTASDAPILDEMIAMRDQMLKQVGDKGPDYTITKKYDFDEKTKKNVMRIIQGTFKVPTFLTSDKPGADLHRDAQGKPAIKGMSDYSFQLHIPRCALQKNGPIPIMQFGHGLFGGAKGEMDSGYERGLINRLCMVQIGHDWIGLSKEDRGYVATSVIPDMNNMKRVVYRLQQAHINAIALTRLILKRLINDKALEVNGKSIIDGKEIYYLGISNGAIQGSGFMALSPDIRKGVLNVGGGPWSLMMSRSSNFQVLYSVMKVFYKNPIERQLLIAFAQVYFDIVDPLTFAPYLIRKPERFGVPKKQVIIQESIGDAQVPNVSTRVWARTMGVPALKTLFEPVFGLPVVEGPVDGSVYTQFGPKPTPFPKDENIPPKDNPAHEGARRAEGCMKQMETFFKPGGKIQHFCKDSCDPD